MGSKDVLPTNQQVHHKNPSRFTNSRTAMDFSLHILFFFLLLSLHPVATDPPLALPSTAYSDELVAFSTCLPYVAVFPNNFTHFPPQQCCDDIPDAFGNGSAICLCYFVRRSTILEFPRNPKVSSTLTQIPNLKTLDLACNQIIGEITRLIYWNEVLQYLGLRGNMLTGTLSPEMCQLTGLWYFDVRGNDRSGTLPDNIGNCTSFEILDISYNLITGEIPCNIGFLQVATTSLQGNMLTRNNPELIGLMIALAVLDLSENELVAPIPSIIRNLSYTGKLYLHGNKLNGPIPHELGNMMKLSSLQLNDNQLTSIISFEFGQLEQLFELNLANNELEGPIPENISSCTALNQLNVRGNCLNGSIPFGLKHLESPTSLNLSSNQFRGSILVELGHIINLDTLDLSSNDFSGSIPASVGGLEHLLTLNLSSNCFNGYIPAEFGNLRSIQTMDISFNKLSGSIPEELGQLQTLASLMMSHRICEKTDALDAAGSTTAAIGKGFAIGSVALVSFARFGAPVNQAKNSTVEVLTPKVFIGLIVGTMLPHWFKITLGNAVVLFYAGRNPLPLSWPSHLVLRKSTRPSIIDILIYASIDSPGILLVDYCHSVVAIFISLC